MRLRRAFLPEGKIKHIHKNAQNARHSVVSCCVYLRNFVYIFVYILDFSVETQYNYVVYIYTSQKERKMVGDTVKICYWCKRPLRWSHERHRWEHEGGGLYIQKCNSCGAIIDQPEPAKICPKCGSKDVIDDHCALPILPVGPRYSL